MADVMTLGQWNRCVSAVKGKDNKLEDGKDDTVYLRYRTEKDEG